MYFNGWESLGRTVIAAFVAYVGLIVLLRISGKRTLAKMNAFDLVVTVALGSTLATVILSKDIALAEGMAALALLIVFQYVVTWLSVRSPIVRRTVRAEPKLLFYQGEFLAEPMKVQRVTESEVRQAARSQGVADLSHHSIVLETDGSISIFPTTADGTSSAVTDVPDFPPHGPPKE